MTPPRLTPEQVAALRKLAEQLVDVPLGDVVTTAAAEELAGGFLSLLAAHIEDAARIAEAQSEASMHYDSWREAEARAEQAEAEVARLRHIDAALAAKEK